MIAFANEQTKCPPTSAWVTMSWWVLECLVIYVTPAAMIALAGRYLVVAAALAPDPLTCFASRTAHEHPYIAIVLGYLALVVLVRYWWQYRSVHTAEATRAGRRISGWATAKTAAAVAVAASTAMLLRNFALEVHEVVGSSMLPSLQDGDRIAVNRAAYRWRPRTVSGGERRVLPQYGDLVAFEFLDDKGTRMRLFKRIIGLPGDLVVMHGAVPSINGWEVPTCDAGYYSNVAENREVAGRLLVEYLGNGWHLLARTMPQSKPFDTEYRVEPGEYFVLGDNRGESIDSRSWNSGLGGGVPLRAIIGRADWFLTRASQEELFERRWLLRRPSEVFDIAGVDYSALNQGIAECLAHRPDVTFPPKSR